jgi:Na+/melibiose symporter-like transporter
MKMNVQKWLRDRPFTTGYLVATLGLLVSAFLLDLVMGGSVPGIAAATGIFMIGLMLMIAVPAAAFLVFNRIRSRSTDMGKYR